VSGGKQFAVSASSDTRLARALSQVATLLLEDPQSDHLLHRLAELCADTIPASVSCGITLSGPDRRPRTIASSGDLATTIDEIQYTIDDGPCLQALRTDAVVRCDDLATDRRWSPFPERAVRRGVRSTLSLPMELPGNKRGVFNLYGPQPSAFDDSDVAVGTVFAEHSGLVVAAAERYLESLELTAHLQDALTSRAVIDQAKGIIMGQRHCSADDAFAQLVAVSQHNNIKLRDVASSLVESVTSRAPAPAPDGCSGRTPVHLAGTDIEQAD
jgi:GAF domain-containing protein